MKQGLLLVNLGTPDSPKPEDVGRYLREFLMDPLVIDIPYVFRWILVNLMIVPKRSHDSGKLYEKVWSASGSPLLKHLRDLEAGMKKALTQQAHVSAGMRYGSPPIASGLRELKEQGVSDLTVFPLYPQYSLAATESSIKKVHEELRNLNWQPSVKFIDPFYDDAHFLDAVAEVSRPYINEKRFDMVLFSFHGLPERQVKKTDPTGRHCLQTGSCCDRMEKANRNCYRAQCYSTARAVAERLGLSAEKYRVAFQSRLGRTPWIRPFSDELYQILPKQGVKRLLVLCPSFVADCLETLEEVQMRGREQFVAAGGEALELIPCINSADVWVQGAAAIARKNL